MNIHKICTPNTTNDALLENQSCLHIILVVVLTTVSVFNYKHNKTVYARKRAMGHMSPI